MLSVPTALGGAADRRGGVGLAAPAAVAVAAENKAAKK